MSSFLPGLRRLAMRPPLYPAACRQCLRQPLSAARPPSPASTTSRVLRLVRQQHTSSSAQTPLHEFGSKIASQGQQAAPDAAAKGAWPETAPKGVGYWLIGSAVSVFGIVVFGGLTRLTESG
jgi:heme a synthase